MDVKKYALLGFSLIIFDSVVVFAEEIPSVPISVVEGARRNNEKLEGTIPHMERMVVAEEGKNVFLPIAIGFTNRIVTPFSDPEIISTSLSVADENGAGEIFVRGNVIYISTVREYPLSMFVTQKGSESHAISLTLIPKKIPAREVVLTIPELKQADVRNQITQAKGDTSEYILSVKRALRSVASNEVPQGYGQQSIVRGTQVPICESDRFTVSFKKGQILNGNRNDIYIGQITNISNETQVADEKICMGKNVIAVAVWPSFVINPLGSSEIYVVTSKQMTNLREISKSNRDRR